MSDQIEIIYDERELLAVGATMTKLQAENFIRPELTVYGKSVVEIAQVYPPSQPSVKPRGKKKKGLALIWESLKGPDYGPEAKHRRTGHFRSQWRITRTGRKDLRIKVENLATYAGYVMGAKQPYTWRYGWKRLKKVMLKQMDNWILWMLHKAFKLWER